MQDREQIITNGSVRVVVIRSGMRQNITLYAKRATRSNIEYVELVTDRVIDNSELIRICNELMLPISAPNAEVFPKGTSAKDFSDMLSLLPA